MGKVYNANRPEDIECPECGRHCLRHVSGKMFRCGYCGTQFHIEDLRTDAEKLSAARRDLNRLRAKSMPGQSRKHTARVTAQRSPRTFTDLGGRVHELKPGDILRNGPGGTHYIEDAKGFRNPNGSYFFLR